MGALEVMLVWPRFAAYFNVLITLLVFNSRSTLNSWLTCENLCNLGARFATILMPMSVKRVTRRKVYI